MSIRTIVEINHDYWQDLRDNPEAMRELLDHLADRQFKELPRGIRVLRSRHHSEKIDLRIE
jgi:hypothetical protein